MSNPDLTLIAQLQSRNAALTVERDACRDESRRLAMELADSQAECERLREHARHCEMEVLTAGDAAYAELNRLQAALQGLKSGVGPALLLRINDALAGTPAPRPPRDESGPPPGFVWCETDNEARKLGRPRRCTRRSMLIEVDTPHAWRLYDAEHGYAPAPPDHGAFRALAESWHRHGDASKDGEWAKGVRVTLSMCQRELLALCSPVVGEPSRAAVEREIRRVAAWRDEDCDNPNETDYGRGYANGCRRHARDLLRIITGAAEDQPQPACPPDVDWSGDPVSTVPGECGYVSDPAPEAQRAQSELPKGWAWNPNTFRYECDRWVIRFVGDDPGVVRIQEGGWCIDAPIAVLRALLGTPAPDIAAAVAELEAARGYLTPGTSTHDRVGRALAHLRPTTEPPGGDKESER
jgi:hypothetical protein